MPLGHRATAEDRNWLRRSAGLVDMAEDSLVAEFGDIRCNGARRPQASAPLPLLQMLAWRLPEQQRLQLAPRDATASGGGGAVRKRSDNFDIDDEREGEGGVARNRCLKIWPRDAGSGAAHVLRISHGSHSVLEGGAAYHWASLLSRCRGPALALLVARTLPQSFRCDSERHRAPRPNERPRGTRLGGGRGLAS
eukprot:scaffold1748_cov258-Pinguiococcus_pyrenoidosus.AAC.17